MRNEAKARPYRASSIRDNAAKSSLVWNPNERASSMSGVIAQRMTAQIDGDFVVFLIGMRINRPFKVWKWLPVARQMPRMLIELGRQPELGLLHARSHFGFPNVFVVQYWRSFEHLQKYATNKNASHLPAWQSFNLAVGSNGDVGIGTRPIS